MKGKNIIITVLITLIVGAILFVANLGDKIHEEADSFYQVYLNGEKIGVIEKDDELYDLIDNRGSDIKLKYGVESVYPPTSLKLVKTNSYIAKLDEVNTVYNKIEEKDDFAIKGYRIHIYSDTKDYNIYVLDKQVFYDAAKKFVNAFLSEEEYLDYINSTQDEIVDTGRIFQNMKFLENITIVEDYISVNEHIYTDEAELASFLLFGDNPDTKIYTVKLGDKIEAISEANKLNVEEFLIANPKFKSQDTILTIGEKVNVTLINPQITFVYNLYEIKDETVYYEKERVADDSKYTSYSEITTRGQNGIYRYRETYAVTNGERSQEADVVKIATIKEVVNQITTYGTKRTSNGISNNYAPVILDGLWGWPTNQGYVITSYRGWRWGRMHQGIDISGAGNFGSPIYAAADGVVTYAFNSCPSMGGGYGDSCGGGMGNNITIDHNNGYTSRYGHLHQTLKVSVGDNVKKGDLIGYMGNSGSSTGSHLHFEILYNGVNLNPLDLYR